MLKQKQKSNTIWSDQEV